MVYILLASSVVAMFASIIYVTHRRLNMGYKPPPERSNLLPMNFHHRGTYGSLATEDQFDPVQEESLATAAIPLEGVWGSPTKERL